jgi:hypothetical protein
LTAVEPVDIVRKMPLLLRRSSPLCATFCLATVALAAVGCGGKSDASTTKSASAVAARTQSTTPAAAGPEQQFITHADGICQRTNARLAQSGPKGEKTAELVAGVVEHETIERRAVAELGGLKPSPALASAWGKMLSDRRDLANGLGALAAATKREDQAAISTLGKSKKSLHADLTKVASATGFKDCAKVG